MCRLAAYQGPGIPIENIVIKPTHSLLDQSQSATEAKLTVNGDGFGISWYNEARQLGLYRDILPAWSDGNLVSLCRMVKSDLFLAHVRASTTGETARVNCHPFTFNNWTFMHNGQIPNIRRIQRQVESQLTDELFFTRRGSTDSEILFLLLMANGLADDPKAACEKALQQFAEVATDQAPNKYACVFSNGAKLWAFRHSTNGTSPSLYVSNKLDNGGTAITSERLDSQTGRWTKIAENSFVEIDDGNITIGKLFET